MSSWIYFEEKSMNYLLIAEHSSSWNFIVNQNLFNDFQMRAYQNKD